MTANCLSTSRLLAAGQRVPLGPHHVPLGPWHWALLWNISPHQTEITLRKGELHTITTGHILLHSLSVLSCTVLYCTVLQDISVALLPWWLSAFSSTSSGLSSPGLVWGAPTPTRSTSTTASPSTPSSLPVRDFLELEFWRNFSPFSDRSALGCHHLPRPVLQGHR